MAEIGQSAITTAGKGGQILSAFLTEHFLLTTPTARRLYWEYAAKLPIVDYHCHVSPRDICLDKHFENITQVWLAEDHYKWRLMRSSGVQEWFITGSASDWEKFEKFAQILPRAIGNPLYHWCHMELKNYFGYDGILHGESAKTVWTLAGQKLREEKLGVRELIRRSRVAFIGTTDDPVATLQWHKNIAADPTISTMVSPTFRPDKALNIDKPEWKSYLQKLSAAADVPITDLASLKEALSIRAAYFAECGCRASDHGLDHMVFCTGTAAEADAVVRKGLRGSRVSAAEAARLKTELLLFCAREYHRLGWVMQIHYNCLRNPNTRMLRQLGPDTGFDCIGPHNGIPALAQFLDELDRTEQLPRMILYSLDAGDNALLDVLLGAFQSGEIPGKLQHGSAWWFHDNKQGIQSHLGSLAAMSSLGNFVGMLTDSRSFLSYTRHEYFRRVLCQLIGQWVECGEYPADWPALGELVCDICYNNAVRYFRLEDKLG